ncbi:MAG: glycosyltransferase family 4 protein [Phycisphaerae bacterium]|nr:glycosyltransferase family 4 protein [Phycisphaerae bacterium]
MRIIQLTPGSGDNFYCENCLRDLTLVKALMQAGHEVTMVPMYLPIKMDAAVSEVSSPLFMGGINVYLQQKFSLFRKTPRWLDQWFDQPKLLNRIGKFSDMTSAKELGKTTVSMLQGEHGKQQKEIERLVNWLACLEPKPEVIIFSNILLAGLAPAFKEKLNVPIVCLLQDEEDFLDALPEPFREQSWQLVREQAKAFDLVISVSDYYRDKMLKRLDTPPNIEVLPVGIDTEAFSPATQMPDVPTLGYLSKMCHDHGLDILINAVHLLRRDKRLEHIRLRITGGSSGADAVFLKKMRQRIASLRLSESIEFVEHYNRPSRQEFLKTLSLMVVPSRKPLAYGLFALESLAAGVPFVAPQLGVFTELANKTQAGVLYEPNNPVKLAETLRPLLLEPHIIQQMAQKGIAAVKEKYAIDNTVKRMTELFGLLLS